MNREILFRGKRLDNGEWVQGYYYKSWDDIYIALSMINGKPDVVQIDPETVGQYTGLMDRNGVKIFEGDILTCGMEGFAICIEWSNGYKRYVAVVPSVHSVHVDLYKFIPALPCMVIGNHWDNPELLGGAGG